MTKQEVEIVKKLVEAARPFLSSEIVDETSRTLPLMQTLGDAIDTTVNLLDEPE